VGELALITSEFLIWMNMIEQFNNKRSKFHAYLNSLDVVSPSILSWDASFLTALSGTNLGNSLMSASIRLRSQHNLLAKLRSFNSEIGESLIPEETYTWDALCWARGHYLARRYPGHFSTGDSECYTSPFDDALDTLAQEIQGEPGLEKLGSLVPILDILNHNHDRDWLSLVINAEEHMLYVNCNYPVRKVRATIPL
jgi:hypothetical protein